MLFMKILYLILALAGSLLACGAGNAQHINNMLEQSDIFQSFGSVSDSDLFAQANHSYPYEFLSKESSVRFIEEGTRISVIVDFLIRIKVYSNDPIEMAEASLVGIPFYAANNIERVLLIDGITHHPDGSRSYLDPESIRTVDLNSRYRIVEFEMPDVSEGAVLEYRYRMERRYLEELPDFYFSERVPTREAVLYMQNSDFVRYNVIDENITFDLEYSEARIDTSSVPLIFTYNRPDPVFVQRWIARSIPALDATAYISSIDDIRGKLKFQISEFGAPRQPLENSWEFVSAQILRHNNPYHFIENYPVLKQAGRQIADHSDTLEQAQDSIFAYVNSMSQYNGQPAVFAERGLDHVLQRQPGNQAEINLTLMAMLTGAGIDARPLYLSGRELGRINKSFPSLFQFNRLMIYSEIGENVTFMDASYPFSMPGLIPVESYNEQGLVLSEREYKWVDIQPERSVFDINLTMEADLTAEGNLSGRLSADVRGYPARQMRERISLGLNAVEIAAETFFESYSNASVTTAEIKSNPEERGVLNITADFKIPSYAVTFSDGIEFRPMVVGYLINNPFEETVRRVPVTLDAPELLTLTYIIRLPDGFRLNADGGTNRTDLRGASLFEEYFIEGNQIEYTFDIQISQKEFPAAVYNQLRRLYERWVNISNENWYIRREPS